MARFFFLMEPVLILVIGIGLAIATGASPTKPKATVAVDESFVARGLQVRVDVPLNDLSRPESADHLVAKISQNEPSL